MWFFFSPFSVAPAPNAEFRKRVSSNVPHLGQHDGDNNGCDDDDDGRQKGNSISKKTTSPTGTVHKLIFSPAHSHRATQQQNVKKTHTIPHANNNALERIAGTHAPGRRARAR